jgi:hypothetical protein
VSITSQEITCSCRKANVFRSDYEARGVQYINRHCLGCGAHWHGPAGNVIAYTRAEWDAALEAA